MLETPEERIRLLKLGISEKNIGKLYLKYNNITIFHRNLLPDKVL